ncbi:MAG: hypothetical protein SH850_21455 [Planctomycetaceae bacterium]|nr:hypothetical protein [Planctomycetaceae bacterium]
MSFPHVFDEPTLNLELTEQEELERHWTLPMTGLEADVADLTHSLELPACPRCDTPRREWLQQPSYSEWE